MKETTDDHLSDRSDIAGPSDASAEMGSGWAKAVIGALDLIAEVRRALREAVNPTTDHLDDFDWRLREAEQLLFDNAGDMPDLWVSEGGDAKRAMRRFVTVMVEHAASELARTRFETAFAYERAEHDKRSRTDDSRESGALFAGHLFAAQGARIVGDDSVKDDHLETVKDLVVPVLSAADLGLMTAFIAGFTEEADTVLG